MSGGRNYVIDTSHVNNSAASASPNWSCSSWTWNCVEEFPACWIIRFRYADVRKLRRGRACATGWGLIQVLLMQTCRFIVDRT